MLCDFWKSPRNEGLQLTVDECSRQGTVGLVSEQYREVSRTRKTSSLVGIYLK